MANLTSLTVDGGFIRNKGTTPSSTAGTGAIMTATVTHNPANVPPTTITLNNVAIENISSSGSGAVATINGTALTADFDPANHGNNNRGAAYAVGDTLQSGYKPDNTNSAWLLTVTSVQGATITIDVSTGNFFQINLGSWNTTISIFTITESLSSGQVQTFDLIITQGSTARQFDWSAITNIKWPGGSGPTITTTHNAVDVLRFNTYDQGTTWYGKVVGQSYGI